MITTTRTNCVSVWRRYRFPAAIILTMLLFAFSATGVSAQEATPTSITLHWTAPGDDGTSGTANEYDIRYSTALITEANWDQASQATGEPSPSAAGTTESFTVGNLQPGTSYYFAIRTADEYPNWSDLSNVINRATLSEQNPPATIADLIAGNATMHSIALNWTAPGDDGTSGTATMYDLRYATVPITGANWDLATQVNGEPSPRPAGTTEAFTVTGLSSGTRYYFAVKAADEVPNWSSLSNVVNLETEDEATAPAAIANLTIDSVTAGAIIISWTAPGDDGTSGTASQYDIRYSAAPISAANFADATQVSGEPSPHPAGSSETFTITGLDSDTRYYIAIKSADEVPNWSDISNVVNSSTIDNTPPAPIMDLSAVGGENDGDLALSWSAPGDNGTLGTASHYLIAYATDSITSENIGEAEFCLSPPDPLPAGSGQNHTLCDLEPGQIYYVAIQSYDEALNGSEISNVGRGIAKSSFILDVDEELAELPDDFHLAQNYPNPFNPATTIEYDLPTASRVSIDIYNVLGQHTATLVDEYKPAGQYATNWNGTDNGGTPVASGIYIYRLQADGFTASKKMIMVQ